MRALELAVEDGNEAPLTLRAVRARAPLPQLYLTAPAGTYQLLVGNADDAPPRYELARVRDLVLTVASSPVAPGPLDRNPDHSIRPRLLTRNAVELTFFWAVLVLAVITLGAITLRLARREDAASQAEGPKREEADREA